MTNKKIKGFLVHNNKKIGLIDMKGGFSIWPFGNKDYTPKKICIDDFLKCTNKTKNKKNTEIYGLCNSCIKSCGEALNLDFDNKEKIEGCKKEIDNLCKVLHEECKKKNKESCDLCSIQCKK